MITVSQTLGKKPDLAACQCTRSSKTLLQTLELIICQYSNGGKATLITRIQEHETRSTLAAIAPEPTPLSIPGAARQMSSVIVHSTPAPTPKTVAPTSAASAPGVPPADMPKYNKQYLDIKFPNISGPDPEPLIQIVSM
jgi:hypothetical protein